MGPIKPNAVAKVEAPALSCCRGAHRLTPLGVLIPERRSEKDFRDQLCQLLCRIWRWRRRRRTHTVNVPLDFRFAR